MPDHYIVSDKKRGKGKGELFKKNRVWTGLGSKGYTRWVRMRPHINRIAELTNRAVELLIRAIIGHFILLYMCKIRK